MSGVGLCRRVLGAGAERLISAGYSSTLRRPRVPGVVVPARTVYHPFGSDHDDHDHDHHDTNAERKAGERRKRRLEDNAHLNEADLDTETVKYRDNRVVGWSPEEIYDVVMEVGEYRRFIPYCIDSTVFKTSERGTHKYMEAELKVGFQLYKLGYTSKVSGSTNLDGTKIVSAVCENKDLFDHLVMDWSIKPGPIDHTSAMHFEVSFRFSNKLYNTVATMFKSSVIDQMIPAFESRLREVYGEPTLLSSLASHKVQVHPRRRKRR